MNRTTGIKTAVWTARVLTGATFIISGWAKCVDPAGFVYKMQEYLAAWNMSGALPADILPVGAAMLSILELLTGVALTTGCLRRAAPAAALALMAGMLPLSVYIFVADPVADCGCFGDLLVISNFATMAKNVVLTALLIAALKWHNAAGPLYRPSLQWIALAVTGIYGLTVAVIGWCFQPVADFRPYPSGSVLTAGDDAAPVPEYIYTKDGESRTFALDALPDSTWTFAGAAESHENRHEGLAIFDDDDEVTDEVLGPDASEGDMLILVVNNPDIDYLTRARFSNELCEAMERRGGRMTGLVAASGETLQRWKDIARPAFDVYSAGDTSLKELARGTAAVVAVRDGVILWKRTLGYLETGPEVLENPMDNVRRYDDGRVALWLTVTFIAALLLLLCIDRLTRTRRRVCETDE